MKVGILGGTFDPVHAGHVDLATACAERLGLDQVLYVATRRPPHKPPAAASEHHRHAMVALATAHRPEHVADPRELERDAVSYTIDTLEELGPERPGDTFFFLTGADSLRELPTWRRWREVIRRATFVATARAGVDLGDALDERAEDIEAGRVVVIDHEPPPWSSTQLRALLGAGQPAPVGSLPDAVLEYIEKNRLYRTASS